MCWALALASVAAWCGGAARAQTAELAPPSGGVDCTARAAVPPRLVRSRAPRARVQDDLTSAHIIEAFAAEHSVDLVLGQCSSDVGWLERLNPSERLRIFVYAKCGNPTTRFVESPYLKVVQLTDKRFHGMQGTVKHYIYENYNDLGDFAIFMKDNNRKQLGLTLLQRLALVVQSAGANTGFINLSDLPVQLHHHKWHKRTSKSSSTRLAIVGSGSADSRGFPKDFDTGKFCALFKRLTCRNDCNNALIPIRTQFVLSRKRMLSLPKAAFDIALADGFSEYTWAFAFNCYQDYKKDATGYPYIICADDVA